MNMIIWGYLLTFGIGVLLGAAVLQWGIIIGWRMRGMRGLFERD